MKEPDFFFEACQHWLTDDSPEIIDKLRNHADELPEDWNTACKEMNSVPYLLTENWQTERVLQEIESLEGAFISMYQRGVNKGKDRGAYTFS
ncbi:hypothetical protein PP178_04050 [Zeaxanthinibacter sp. PT1]|uniref:hypothetical protein n=1 Tax=Zeaxanthinibacter TaxID=561554 RepID=UPI002349158F|nr:hypothetical protein [Zeaxanthinibacter sp. PT1]MDC6350713.1 hypothetical protein [Zeaxanthinibacter sp. PT1]